MTDKQKSPKSVKPRSKLTELEKKIIALIQTNIPVTKRPFLELAQKIGVEEEVVLKTLQKLHENGTIRRFGATIRHQISGYEANAMVAWQVDEDRIDEVGEMMASFEGVSHCYSRNPVKEWPYNLYTMIHGKTEKACYKMAEDMSAKTSVKNYTLLFSRDELKKTSMKYFP
ncbi:MAG: Lrp/AsnC family transcriptional regulator [Deltaproteobacteria bacterium]|nr:Lrp/AsnC family transcriptional regulator [Deltaproteobacteria bacterium]MBW2019621.1 Lrp/AsnC family transcriptional regulator [Deltaproteobacteria bacterium]MBW2074436.1 Lrp/AsnC family transcriptional regulator [Deltaproteobacteria bacterium]RLB82376.1 MAG: Lrp/AsnC family transcriptional regulator [Deltaproteobacteria bacterium]